VPIEGFFGDFDVFAGVYTNDEVNTSFRLGYRLGGSTIFSTPNLWKRVDNASTWELLHLGSINASPMIRAGYNAAHLFVRVEYQKDAADTAELDFIWLVPKQEPQMRLECFPTLDNFLRTGTFWGIGNDEDFDYSGKEDPIDAPTGWKGTLVVHGSIMALEPRIENRLYLTCISWNLGATRKEYECHGAATDLQMIVNINYLPQYMSPLE